MPQPTQPTESTTLQNAQWEDAKIRGIWTGAGPTVPGPDSLYAMGPERLPVPFAWWKVALFLVVAALGVAFFWLDQPVFQFVHDNFNYYTRPVPTGMKLPTRILRSMEDWGESVFIVAICVAMWRMDRHHRSRILCLVMAALLSAAGVEAAKRVTGRERPEVSTGATVFHGPSRWSEGGDYQSFPSGHTASGASYSGSLAAFYPPLRPVVAVLALGCGANRIWKERHFLSDCWLGGCFGFWLAFTLSRRRWMQPILAGFDRWFSVPITEPASGRVLGDSADSAGSADGDGMPDDSRSAGKTTNQPGQEDLPPAFTPAA